ncbi:MAG: glycosyltransferase family 4 protein [Anaerolineales bacterium]|nr:glycosyltransferase family 4 protein [Anaerolineales bacterium]MDP7643407.1 glycosyltransferase family 4 protein [Anaerolineales bacterium]HJN42529.1 glycosyltransferase family 4 protein [Anaerolineales bacterium]|tara:strand:- start:181 stop:1335 length:1155 start_codon:yes stop_codon:yes gene_type:complete
MGTALSSRRAAARPTVDSRRPFPGRLQRLADRVSSCLPWPRTAQPRCFFGLRETPGGPGFFSRKLTREFERQGRIVTHTRLRAARAALLFSVSWGDWFYRLCRLWGVRTVLRVDGFMLPSYFDNRAQPSGFQARALTTSDMRLNYRMQRDLLRADHVVYQSVFSKEMADAHLYNRRERYSVVHNGVDLERFQPEGRRGGRVRLLAAGSLRHEYMLGTILPVFARLWHKHDLELHVVGTLGQVCRRQLADFGEQNPEASERIRVVGAIDNDDMPREMNRADVLLHPRLGDWCPNVVVEAMACGLPVVCGSWGGAAELVGAGGIVVPTEKWSYGAEFVAGMATAAESVLASLAGYRESARKHAESEFDIRDVAEKYALAMGLKHAG